MRRPRIATLALGALLALTAAPAHAIIDPPFFHAGECEYAALSVHAWHEFGHDVATLAAGDAPLSPGALWGDKWTSAHPRAPRIALGGLVAQLIVAAFDAALEEPEPSCAPAMSTVGAAAYAARSRLAPDFAGDYDPFSARGRGLVGVGSVATSILLDALAEHRVHASLFAGERPTARFVQVPLAEPEPDAVAAPAASPLILRTSGDAAPVPAALAEPPPVPLGPPAPTPLPGPPAVLPVLTLFPALPSDLPGVTPQGSIEARDGPGERTIGPALVLPEAPLASPAVLPAALPREVSRE
jgi:hypothetical protein